ncbi:hypothetical protein THTE_3110 [Thermogutta terrifontis]|uniref:Uncharacterized protein n=1 Tax=Thermogutta terrifontis TaxID=1331910 RepID=A0A286RIE3_9BACT|nr:hypothetical protein THTE_3110 [Thermogutta terrifontis]
MPGESKWNIERGLTDPTSGSLREKAPEGHACRARAKGIDHRTLHSGRDKHVPPKKTDPTSVALRTR